MALPDIHHACLIINYQYVMQKHVGVMAFPERWDAFTEEVRPWLQNDEVVCNANRYLITGPVRAAARRRARLHVLNARAAGADCCWTLLEVAQADTSNSLGK